MYAVRGSSGSREHWLSPVLFVTICEAKRTKSPPDPLKSSRAPHSFRPRECEYLQMQKSALTTQMTLCYKGGFPAVPPYFISTNAEISFTDSNMTSVVLVTEDAGLPLVQKPPCPATMLGAIRPEPQGIPQEPDQRLYLLSE